MTRVWLDIEDLPNNEYQVGFLVENNNIVQGYEFFINDLKDVVKIIDFHHAKEVYYFDGNDSNYIFTNVIDLCQANEKTKNVYFKNVGLDYKVYLEGSKLQMTKNSDIAKAFGINVNFSRLHQPLYDIQLTYCSHHNFCIEDEQVKKDKIFNSFFVLTNKFDILWKVLKKFNVPRQFVNVKIVKPINPKNVYFVELKERSLNDKYLLLIDVVTNEHKEIDIKKHNVLDIVRLFEENFMIFTDALQHSNLSRHLWEIQYMNFETRKLNSESFSIIKDLYIFMCINISRFKLAINDFDYDKVREKLGTEITLEHLKEINKIN